MRTTIGAVLTLVACHAGAPSERPALPPDLASLPSVQDLGIPDAPSSFPIPDLHTMAGDLREPRCAVAWTDRSHLGSFVVRSAARKDAYGRNADDGSPAYARCPLSAPDTTIATDTTLRVFLDISLQDAPHGDAGALIYVELSFREEGSGRIGWTGPSGLYAPGRYEVTGTAPGAISAPSMLIDVAYANAADPQSAALVQVQLGEIRSRAPCSP